MFCSNVENLVEILFRYRWFVFLISMFRYIDVICVFKKPYKSLFSLGTIKELFKNYCSLKSTNLFTCWNPKHLCEHIISIIFGNVNWFRINCFLCWTLLHEVRTMPVKTSVLYFIFVLFIYLHVLFWEWVYKIKIQSIIFKYYTLFLKIKVRNLVKMISRS